MKAFFIVALTLAILAAADKGLAEEEPQEKNIATSFKQKRSFIYPVPAEYDTTTKITIGDDKNKCEEGDYWKHPCSYAPKAKGGALALIVTGFVLNYVLFI
jgi:hypothetical protein